LVAGWPSAIRQMVGRRRQPKRTRLHPRRFFSGPDSGFDSLRHLQHDKRLGGEGGWGATLIIQEWPRLELRVGSFSSSLVLLNSFAQQPCLLSPVVPVVGAPQRPLQWSEQPFLITDYGKTLLRRRRVASMRVRVCDSFAAAWEAEPSSHGREGALVPLTSRAFKKVSSTSKPSGATVVASDSSGRALIPLWPCGALVVAASIRAVPAGSQIIQRLRHPWA